MSASLNLLSFHYYLFNKASLIFILTAYVLGIRLTQSFSLLTASNELVFINFYAEWCRFSNMLQPIFDEAADKVREAFPEAGRVVMGKVDCDKECKYFFFINVRWSSLNKSQNIYLLNVIY